MLDVYRSYYGLSGEPFRLGPDYRFSLHHTSYANAKAYLDYAIYQGEGFIAITGEPGTGKTTLISEILATLDRTRVQVATLTSTQLESRDLLHMVASSFGLQPERVDKADLLLEIESFLVKKIHGGQRAMLIVDEAQGLSGAALEELRLLANLQYQYQLLLQICLVGQEKLLDLIHAPGMEHLQQRLVAATSLEPLGFDETIDYIEHRLSKVGWKGDPAIDEAALRLIFRYSLGTPRRINLIVNRLFLYGGMEHKHRLTGADTENVIAGLMEEHLLGSQTPLEDSDIAPPAPDRKGKFRSLPRARGTGKAAPAPKTADREQASAPGTGKPAGATAANLKWDNENLPGSRPQARAGGQQQGPARKAAATADETTRVRSRQPAFAARGPEPPPDALRRRQPAAGVEEKKSVNKGLILVGLLLISAVAAYYLRIDFEGLDRVTQIAGKNTAMQSPAPDTPEQNSAEVATDSLSGDMTAGTDEQAVDVNPDIPPAAVSEQGSIVRLQAGDEIAADADAGGAATASSDTAPVSDASITTEPQTEIKPADRVSADSGVEAVDGQAETPAVSVATAADTAAPAAATAPAADDSGDTPEPAPAVRAAAEPTPVVAAKPAASAPPAPLRVPAPAQPGVATADAIAARRDALQEAAERRFSQQLARVQSGTTTAPPVSAAPVAAAPAAAPPVIAAPIKVPAAAPETTVIASRPKISEPAVKKKPRITANDIKTSLLEGRWVSSNKPASLLPSETTFCNQKQEGISCVSVPQNVKTQYGLALYKVESQLTRFSAEGLFEMSYRTLVKLVGDKASGAAAQDWQVTEYAMSCQLDGTDRVSCLDGKGITREYRRLPR